MRTDVTLCKEHRARKAAVDFLRLGLGLSRHRPLHARQRVRTDMTTGPTNASAAKKAMTSSGQICGIYNPTE